MDICPRCDALLNVGEKEVEFEDDFSESTLTVTMDALWCDVCNWFKIKVA